MNHEQATAFVVKTGLELGFHRVGVTSQMRPARYKEYEAWLGRGDHGDMHYMGEEMRKKQRANLRNLLPHAKSAIVVALAYNPRGGLTHQEPGPTGKIARFAQGDDYHHVMKQKLFALAEELANWLGEPIQSRACVDSAPVLERELAETAGLGFIGKNTMLITPGLGSNTALGVLLCDVPMADTKSEPRDCGTCQLCLTACPTNAFRGPYQLDARKCISYLTIEQRGSIAPELREKMGTWIFGCDECQDACPYNARAPLKHQPAPELEPRTPDRGRPSLPDLAALGSNQRKRWSQKSALNRASRETLLRNVANALGNVSKKEVHNPLVHRTLATLASDRSQLVAEHADSSLERLGKKSNRSLDR